MESLPRSLNYELPHNLHYDKNAPPQVFDTNSNSVASATNIVNLASTPTITTLDSITANEFLQKLGASLLNSIQLQNFHNSRSEASSSLSSSSNSYAEALPSRMDFDLSAARHLSFNTSSNYDPFDELQKQLEYDKLMNEVWIGIVFTLILISLVFCICSCFLYHQFRTWKRNYHNTIAQANDVESMKFYPEGDDPVPEYTLVSGLPSYEAALELMKKSQKPCLLVYPSVYNIFNQNEKQNVNEDFTQHVSSQQQQNSSSNDCTTPLLSQSPSTVQPEKLYLRLDIPSYEDVIKSSSPHTTTMTNKVVNLENKEKSISSLPATATTPNDSQTMPSQTTPHIAINIKSNEKS